MFKSGPPNIETTSTASDDEHENFLLINNQFLSLNSLQKVRRQCCVSSTEASTHSIHTNFDLQHSFIVLRGGCLVSKTEDSGRTYCLHQAE